MNPLPEVGRATLLEWLRLMLVIRRVGECVVRWGQQGLVRSSVTSIIGQELAAVVAVAQLSAQDVMFCAHRNHAQVLARGADAGRLLAEVLGRADGYAGGAGGMFHVAPRELNVVYSSAIVGGILPIGTGAALMLRGGGERMSVTLFGDGAMEQGVSFEALNMASLWRLPVLYLCENNSGSAGGLAAGEYPASTLAAQELVAIPKSLGIWSRSVDGGDAGAVHQAVREARAVVLSGTGPAFVEARTVRWPGSRLMRPELVSGETDVTMAWDERRIPEKHAQWLLRDDPLLGYARQLLGCGAVLPAEIEGIDTEVRRQIADAEAFALRSALPSVPWEAELLGHVGSGEREGGGA